MPELGEVDLLATRLNARLREQGGAPTLTGGAASHNRFETMWQQCAPHLIGAELARIYRKGKYLIFQWSGDRGLLLGHLRMTGWWAWHAAPQTLTVVQGYTLDRHPRLVLDLHWPDGSPEQLIYYDSRVLGEIAFYADPDWRNIPQLAAQAPDFIDTENSPPGSYLKDEAEFLTLVQRQQTRATKRSIRDLLLDQSQQGLGAGLGNYLIAEVLYRAGVHPDRSFTDLDLQKLKEIYRISCQLFRHVIANEAEAAATMIIYQREQCPRGHAIKRDKKGNRGSYYCPECQKK